MTADSLLRIGETCKLVWPRGGYLSRALLRLFLLFTKGVGHEFLSRGAASRQIRSLSTRTSGNVFTTAASCELMLLSPSLNDGSSRFVFCAYIILLSWIPFIAWEWAINGWFSVTACVVLQATCLDIWMFIFTIASFSCSRWKIVCLRVIAAYLRWYKLLRVSSRLAGYCRCSRSHRHLKLILVHVLHGLGPMELPIQVLLHMAFTTAITWSVLMLICWAVVFVSLGVVQWLDYS